MSPYFFERNTLLSDIVKDKGCTGTWLWADDEVFLTKATLMNIYS